ncbi:YheE family protein [Halalkalibacter alkaliphilus]|uniref:YheE family protein n=1 Tax=Halalkalibacter alkaliphilus TaxID=2917993 RepID=A0A9X2A0J0_9BACI|nr:YheE family protein [Halalkalibacter alkaliphilus]MCL7747022.1 YheE family protein [Halalkalibacter alkaliphilus]
MLVHFQWKELRNNLLRREWAFSFFHEGQYMSGIYYKNGSIKWGDSNVSSQKKEKLEPYVHDLMLYHVYEQH